MCNFSLSNSMCGWKSVELQMSCGIQFGDALKISCKVVWIGF